MEKILILANNEGGLFQFRRELLAKLAGTYEIYIAVPSGEYRDYFTSCGYKCIDIDIDRRGMNPVKDYALYKSYKKLIKKIAPDKVITYTIKCNIYGAAACPNNTEVYVNVTGLGSAFAGGLLKKFVVMLYKRAIKNNCKAVFFENSSDKNVFVANKIIDESRAVVLNGAGVNLERYAFTPMPNNDITTFLFVGRLMKEKGVDELFSAIERIAAEGRKAKFVILGGYEEDYKTRIDELTAKGLIEYKGIVNNVPDYLKDSDCFVLPSYSEGMSNAILEACSCGRPVIVSDIAGCKEAVNDGKNGFLCKPADAESLYECLIRFMDTDKRTRDAMGFESRKYMQNVFDKNKVVADTIKIIMEK